MSIAYAILAQHILHELSNELSNAYAGGGSYSDTLAQA